MKHLHTEFPQVHVEQADILKTQMSNRNRKLFTVCQVELKCVQTKQSQKVPSVPWRSLEAGSTEYPTLKYPALTM